MHRQIYGALRRFILDGQISPHTLLPSTRSLAEDLKVGRNTVIAAYDQLLAEGFIEARAGSGTWVAPIQQGRPSAAARSGLGTSARLSRRGQTIVNGPQPPRNAGVMNFHPGVPETASFPFSIWSSLLVRNSRSRDESLLGYLSFAGHPGLRATIASNISVSRGINCTRRPGHHRHRRAGSARPRLARADGRGRPCLDGGARLSRREERLPRQRRETCAAEGRPARLEPLRPRPAAAAADLRHAVLPMAVRHDHAHRGAAATARHRRAPRRLGHRGRLSTASTASAAGPCRRCAASIIPTASSTSAASARR